MSQPEEVNVGMAEALGNIANILKTGLFAGVNAAAVAAAVSWCDNGAQFYGAKNPAQETELKAVPDEQPAQA